MLALFFRAFFSKNRDNRNALGKSVTTILADKGYNSRQDIKDTQDLGVSTLVPKTDTSGSEKKGIFKQVTVSIQSR